MSVFLPQRPEFLKAKLDQVLHGPPGDSGRLSGEALSEARAQLRQRFVPLPATRPIILTGHQPIFYHPGIFIKDVLADALARVSGGVALNMVVDTDETELAFDFPFPDRTTANGRLAVRRRFVLGPSGGMLRDLRLDPVRGRMFTDQLHGYLPRVGEVFDEPQASSIVEWTEATCRAAVQARSIMEPAVILRETYEKHAGLSISTIYASDLVHTEAFSYFTRFIIERGDHFRSSYNATLRRYREAHGIKNAAQPLPDLEPDELPFWRLDGDRRSPLRGRDAAGGVVFPKAITLTLFCRLFLCDLFIHGRGGGRYDVITDRLLEDFFECPGAPFTVASATLVMQPRSEYPLEARSLAAIDRDVRSLTFEPTRFLESDHPLVLERRGLIAERNRPGADLRRIHHEFLRINEAARPLARDVPRRLAEERVLSALASENRAVFLDRTFPFFFYDLEPLFEAVKPYGPGEVGPGLALRSRGQDS